MHTKVDNLRNVIFKLLDDFSGFKNILMNLIEEVEDLKNMSPRNSNTDSSLVNLVTNLSDKIDKISCNNNATPVIPTNLSAPPVNNNNVEDS